MTQPSRFQRCNLTDLACYLLVCAIAYPFLYLITLLAGGRSLFTARLLVGLGCAIVALSLGFFLQELEIRFLEVASKSDLRFEYFDVREDVMC
jgi:hypothetical protein